MLAAAAGESTEQGAGKPGFTAKTATNFGRLVENLEERRPEDARQRADTPIQSRN
jgi:hypothetical protein